MFALTLVDRPEPTPIGLKSWCTFFGIIAVPAATFRRSPSGSIPSTAATYRTSSVALPRFACSICVIRVLLDGRSVGRRGGPQLADHGDLDASRVLHPSLDLLCQVGRQMSELVVADHFGTRDDPNLPPGLDGITVLYALHLVRQPFQLLDALHVVHDALAPRSGSRAGDGVSGRHED